MAVVRLGGLMLVATALWRNAARARLAIRRGDYRIAGSHLEIIARIGRQADHSSVKRLAASTLRSLRRKANGLPEAHQSEGDCA